MQLVPLISPEMGEPYHLHEWCGLIELAAEGQPVRALCAEPIRHWKSQTTMHGLIRILLRDPTTPIIHLSHSFERAQTIGKRVRQIAEACDRTWGSNIGPTKGSSTIADWRNDRGGGVVVMSADQSRLGYDCGCLIFDDPIDEHGSQDPKVRESVDETITHYTARCMRKGKPGPALGVASPWHLDDPLGRRRARQARSWTYVRHPAIIDEGKPTERAYAPNVWPLDELKAMRAELKEQDPSERIWWAQLMCDPQPEGSDLFGAAHYYDRLPDHGGWRVGHGVDFAYSDAPGSDFFAAVSCRIYGRKLYIVDVQRHKLDAVLLENTCRDFLSQHGRSPLWSYQSGPEVGLSKMLIGRGVPIGIMRARYNKRVRAQKTIRRWNEGDILVPRDKPWLRGFLHRVSLFRGHDKDRDDEVDALVSLSDACLGGASAGTIGAIGSGRRPYPGMM